MFGVIRYKEKKIGYCECVRSRGKYVKKSILHVQSRAKNEFDEVKPKLAILSCNRVMLQSSLKGLCCESLTALAQSA